MAEFFNRSSERDLGRRLRKELTPAEAMDSVVEAVVRALGLEEEPPCIPPS